MKMAFNLHPETMVLTSVDITREGFPILEVSHDDDEEGGSLWQFHSGGGDYDAGKLQLVRLDTILRIDPELVELGGMAAGCTARRRALGEPWKIT